MRRLAVVALLLPSLAFGADYYDWSVRTDRDGKPAGVYTTTPFPITEASTEYSVTNDEGAKTYTLGTKLYVATTGADSGNCQTFGSPCASIAYAIAQSSAGNYTIIVRDGTYSENNLTPKTGTDDTHRWMIVGYGQERPVIDGAQSSNIMWKTTGADNAFVTLQRLRLQNNKERCVRIGSTATTKRDAYFNMIDVSVDNCASDTKTVAADGNIYYLGADNAYISHVTSSHTMGHGIKVGDSSAHAIVEWSKVYECGYWSGIVAEMGIDNWAASPGTHPSGIDFPNDAGVTATNNVARYNIIYDTLYYGLQFRNTPNFSAHHNEVYNTPRFDDVVGAATGMTGSPQVAILGQGSAATDSPSGTLYANKIHDAGDATSSGVSINAVKNGYTVNLYNNLIYGNPLGEIYLYGYLSPAGSSRSINILNNTLAHNGTTAAITPGTNYAAGEVTIKNNVITQAGAGAAVAYDADFVRSYNLYYAPAGSVGTTLGTGEVNADPLLTDYAPAYNSPGVDAGTNLPAVATDILGESRPYGVAWDMGAYEYQGIVPPAGAVPPPGIRGAIRGRIQ